MQQKTSCPICSGNDLKSLFTTTAPVLQNKVYESVDEAEQSVQGAMVLTYCSTCQFVFNGAFDDSIVIYDEHYDNSVPSAIFKAYYERIADYLYDKYALKGKTVYDIGCGKGTFLEILCGKHPDVAGVGIDPSYEGNEHPQQNLKFIKDFFHKSQISVAPDLVLSRHVFEHIEQPVGFLNIIQEALEDFKDVPFFIEVPDFGWIVKHQTFWDICYEHCNYFSPPSVTTLVEKANSKLDSITPAFDNQYMWIEGLLNPSTDKRNDTVKTAALDLNVIDRFAGSIANLETAVVSYIQKAKDEGYKIALWGMATKGVIFSNIVDPQRQLIDYCIDVNNAKQQKYTPVTGHKILPPETLSNGGGSKLLVIVMNPVYLDEIRQQAAQYSRDCRFVDAHGKLI